MKRPPYAAARSLEAAINGADASLVAGVKGLQEAGVETQAAKVIYTALVASI